MSQPNEEVGHTHPNRAQPIVLKPLFHVAVWLPSCVPWTPVLMVSNLLDRPAQMVTSAQKTERGALRAQMVTGATHRTVYREVVAKVNIRPREKWSVGNAPKDMPAQTDGTDGYSISADDRRGGDCVFARLERRVVSLVPIPFSLPTQALRSTKQAERSCSSSQSLPFAYWSKTHSLSFSSGLPRLEINR